MRIAVLDDDRHETEEIVHALHGWDPSRSAENFSNGAELLEKAAYRPHYTVAFIDIFLPRENGVDIARELRHISPETEIVFTTTSREYAVEAFSVNALHYLVKPVSTENIREVFDRITKKQKSRRSVCITEGRCEQLLFLDEIISAQSYDHRMILSMRDSDEHETYMKCGELAEKLGKDFILIQRGLLVNAAFIKKMNPDSCELQDGRTVLFSRRNKESIRKAYHEYVFRMVSPGTERKEDEIQ